MQDIKIAGRETASLEHWEQIQYAALQTQIRSETVEQWQMLGARFISRAGLVIISVISALAAAHGKITIGEMTVATRRVASTLLAGRSAARV